jgi:hypothetical protein
MQRPSYKGVVTRHGARHTADGPAARRRPCRCCALLRASHRATSTVTEGPTCLAHVAAFNARLPATDVTDEPPPAGARLIRGSAALSALVHGTQGSLEVCFSFRDWAVGSPGTPTSCSLSSYAERVARRRMRLPDDHKNRQPRPPTSVLHYGGNCASGPETRQPNAYLRACSTTRQTPDTTEGRWHALHDRVGTSPGCHAGGPG